MIIEKKLASFEQSNEVGSSFFTASSHFYRITQQRTKSEPFPNQSRSSNQLNKNKKKGKYKTKNQTKRRTHVCWGVYTLNHSPSILPYQSSVIDSQRPFAGLQQPNTQRKPDNRPSSHPVLERNTSVATLLSRGSTTGPAGIAARLRIRNLRRSSNGSLESAGG